MESYTTIKERASFEYEDRKSVFIADSAPVSNEADALAFLEYVKKKYPDARHHVYAYVLRENFICRFSDDHEPQGTAGMPVLDVIRKNGVTDAIIVVTRYFGGTLLGTGGLVRAYTAAAIGALNTSKIIKYDIYAELEFSVSYSDYGKISMLLSDHSFRCDDTDFGADVKIKGRLLKSGLEKFEKALLDITSGKTSLVLLSERFDF